MERIFLRDPDNPEEPMTGPAALVWYFGAPNGEEWPTTNERVAFRPGSGVIFMDTGDYHAYVSAQAFHKDRTVLWQNSHFDIGVYFDISRTLHVYDPRQYPQKMQLSIEKGMIWSGSRTVTERSGYFVAACDEAYMLNYIIDDMLLQMN